MKKFKIVALFLILSLCISVFAAAGALAVSEPEVSSTAVLLLERQTGEVFFSLNETVRMAPAGLAKLMTALVAIEAIDNGDISLYEQITAGQIMYTGLDSDPNITAGDTLSLESLLYYAVLSSSGAACNIIADAVGGDIATFLTRMNARASELGCTNTNFSNVHGAQDDNLYTTAKDMAHIINTALDNSLFYEMFTTFSVEIPETGISSSKVLSSSNPMMDENSQYYYEDCTGGKAGFTTTAGYCLTATSSKDNVELLVVVLGGTTEAGSVTAYTDAASLLTWVYENFSYQQVLSSTEIIVEVPISMALKTETVSLRPDKSIMALLSNSSGTKTFKREISIFNEESGAELVAPIPAGTVLGKIVVSKDGVVYGTVDLVASTSIELDKAEYMRAEISKTLDSGGVKLVIWILVILLILYVVFVVRYRMRHMRYVKAVKSARTEAEARFNTSGTGVTGVTGPTGVTSATGGISTTSSLGSAASRPAPVSEEPAQPEYIPQTAEEPQEPAEELFSDMDDLPEELVQEVKEPVSVPGSPPAREPGEAADLSADPIPAGPAPSIRIEPGEINPAHSDDNNTASGSLISRLSQEGTPERDYFEEFFRNDIK